LGVGAALTTSTVSLVGNTAIIPSLVKCQSLAINEQLQVGIRYLDLRISFNDDANNILPSGHRMILYIYHGSFKMMIFNTAAEQIRDFLIKNPR
jgi:hypothetical protein